MWPLIPLHLHGDQGFGMLGSSFMEVAKLVHAQDRSERQFYSEVATAYLFRHAIELFLKSLIVILELRNAPKRTVSSIRLDVSGRPVPLARTHNLEALYQRLCTLAKLGGERLSLQTLCDWGAALVEVQEDMGYLHRLDGSGTSLRYPSPILAKGGESKSLFYEMDPSEIDQLLQAGSASGKFEKLVVVEDQHGNVQSTYRMRPDFFAIELEVIERAASTFQTLHTCARATITDPY